jgi:hypothetical protein
MSIFSQSIPRRNYGPFNPETAQAGSRNPLSAGTSGWSWRNPLNLIPFGIIALAVLSFVLMVAQDAKNAPPRDLATSALVTGQYVTATTDLPLYQRNRDGNYVHTGVLFGGLTVQVTGASAHGQWWRVPCGGGSSRECWVTAGRVLNRR